MSFPNALTEKHVSPRQFAKIFLQDLDLPVEQYQETVANSIEQQIDEQTVADIQLGPAAGGPWAAAPPPAGSSSSNDRSAPPAPDREKEGRQWDWGIQETFEAMPPPPPSKKRRIAGAQVTGRAPEAAEELPTAVSLPPEEEQGAGEDAGDVEDDLRVVIDVSDAREIS